MKRTLLDIVEEQHNMCRITSDSISAIAKLLKPPRAMIKRHYATLAREGFPKDHLLDLARNHLDRIAKANIKEDEKAELRMGIVDFVNEHIPDAADNWQLHPQTVFSDAEIDALNGIMMPGKPAGKLQESAMAAEGWVLLVDTEADYEHPKMIAEQSGGKGFSLLGWLRKSVPQHTVSTPPPIPASHSVAGASGMVSRVLQKAHTRIFYSPDKKSFMGELHGKKFHMTDEKGMFKNLTSAGYDPHQSSHFIENLKGGSLDMHRPANMEDHLHHALHHSQMMLTAHKNLNQAGVEHHGALASHHLDRAHEFAEHLKKHNSAAFRAIERDPNHKVAQHFRAIEHIHKQLPDR